MFTKTEEQLYSIVRHYCPSDGRPSEIVRTDLTLEEAQAHCRDPETSTSTYFDGYTSQ